MAKEKMRTADQDALKKVKKTINEELLEGEQDTLMKAMASESCPGMSRWSIHI